MQGTTQKVNCRFLLYMLMKYIRRNIFFYLFQMTDFPRKQIFLTAIFLLFMREILTCTDVLISNYKCKLSATDLTVTYNIRRVIVKIYSHFCLPQFCFSSV